MSYNLDKEDEKRIIELAKKYRVEKVILFGSRARGNNRPDSDVDLALSGGNYFEFAFDFDDESNGNIRPTIKSQGRILQGEFLERMA